jgi:hypothetical protein
LMEQAVSGRRARFTSGWKGDPAAARIVVIERDTFYSAFVLGARRDDLPEL